MTELPKRFEEIPRTGQVILYCACIINEIAERAAFLGFRGYRNIFVLLDGYPGWVKRGYPLKRVAGDGSVVGFSVLHLVSLAFDRLTSRLAW